MDHLGMVFNNYDNSIIKITGYTQIILRLNLLTFQNFSHPSRNTSKTA
jgi:hypothetical protein